MKIILAFDSFKGSLSALQACQAAAQGLARLQPAPQPQVILCPLSDGGEGFAETLRIATHADALPLQVHGPRPDPVNVELTMLDGGRTAVIEARKPAACPSSRAGSAIRCLPPPVGVGEMLAAAAAAGATEAIVGLGGSSTNDGGMGLLSALGWQFFDAVDRSLPPIGACLEMVQRIEAGKTPLDLQNLHITVACDVTNPLYGPAGAARTFAAQKGATPAEVDRLEAGMQHYARVCADYLGEDYANLPGAGAAGGLGFALRAFLHAEYRPGAEIAIALSGLPTLLRDADLCLTGEGQTDAQTASGKLPSAVAHCCQDAGVPCICLSGALGDGWQQLYDHGFTAILSISQRPQPLSAALKRTSSALADTAEALARLYGDCLRQKISPPISHHN